MALLSNMGKLMWLWAYPKGQRRKEDDKLCKRFAVLVFLLSYYVSSLLIVMAMVWYTGCQRLFMSGFRFRLRRSCLRPAADETKLPVAREKKTSGTQGNGLIEALRSLRMTIATNSEYVVLTRLESYKQYSWSFLFSAEIRVDYKC